jgi:hypothetical protein
MTVEASAILIGPSEDAADEDEDADEAEDELAVPALDEDVPDEEHAASKNAAGTAIDTSRYRLRPCLGGKNFIELLRSFWCFTYCVFPKDAKLNI